MKEPKTTIANMELLEFFLKQKNKTKGLLFDFARQVSKKMKVGKFELEKKDKAAV